MDNKTLILLYKSLVRPILEYGPSVWAPFLKRQSSIIEKVQRRATKLIPELAHLDYTERLKYLRLPSLKYRRIRRGDLIQVFNILQCDNKEKENFNKYFTLTTSKHNQRRGHSFKLYKNHCKSNIRKYSFAFRVINTCPVTEWLQRCSGRCRTNWMKKSSQNNFQKSNFG